jgi:protein involved in polysaccharide export with SLBB domain
MIKKKLLSLGFAALGVVAFSAYARQPQDSSSSAASNALQQLVRLGQTSSTHQASNFADGALNTNRAPSDVSNGDNPAPEVASTTTNTTQGPALQRRYPRYHVERGDGLSIQFSFVPDFNQTVTVQPDGYINLRGVGDLHVEGLTAPEAAEQIRRRYSKIMNDPVVTVTLTDFEKPYFIVGGQVGHPGKFDLRGDTTVAQAIEIAGGFTDRSKHSQVLLFRKVSDGWVEARKLDMKEMLAAGNLTEDLHLEPGDMLFVPQNTISKIERFLPLPHPGIIINPNSF